MVPKTFKVDLPEELTKEALKCQTDEEARQVGIEWCTAQSKDLLVHGAPAIHYYTMGKADNIREILKRTF